jgi:alanine racemase
MSASASRVVAFRHPLIEAGPDGSLPPLPRTAWLEIDLDALVANVDLLQASLPAGCRIEPVVKADAYGHGAVPVARALEAAGIRSFSVATYDEALELRLAGIEVPILILYPIPPEYIPAAFRHRFSVAAGDPVLLSRTLAALDAMPAEDAAPETLAIHLEVETGLGRGGFLPADVTAAAAAIEAAPRARLAGLWSHLQAAGNADITAGQVDRFGVAAALLESARATLPDRHLAASGAILGATAPNFDVVRAGLAQYGIVPDGLVLDDRALELVSRLRPVMSLRARPVRVARLAAGTGISYGPSFVASRDSVIATLPLGYADGWTRSLSNKAEVLVRGMRVPAVGTVAMDALMVDVTDVPGEQVTVDDEFTLIGEQDGLSITATDVAQWGNTISYEVVTGMSGRLPRVYYAAAKAVRMRTVACEIGRDGASADTGSAAATED